MQRGEQDLGVHQSEAYAQKNKFRIDGEGLTEQEIAEQKQNLLSKIFTVGYMLHRYKSLSRPWSFFDDATDLLKSHGLLLGDMSRATGRLNYSFKEYIAVFRDVFRNQSAQLDFAADFDTMKGAVLKALNQLDENQK